MTIIPALLISAPIWYLALGLTKACRTQWIIMNEAPWHVRLMALSFVVFIAPFHSLMAAASGGICLIDDKPEGE